MRIPVSPRRFAFGLLALALLILVLGGARPLWAAPIDEAPAMNPAAELSGLSVREILVDFRDDVPDAEIETLGRQLGLSFHLNSPDTEDSKLFVADALPERMPSLIATLSRDPRVESAEPNFYMAGLWNRAEDFPLTELRKLAPTRKKLEPNDPLYKYQWHMQKIGMEEAWAGASGRDVVVAVIDTGVAYEDYGKFIQVEDLKGTRFVKGYNYITRSDHANDDHGHGTHVAGTIAQATNNGVGVTGVAFKASIMPLKVLSGRGFGTIGDIAAAIRFAANHGAKVINMSLGGASGAKALESACRYAHKKGVTIVCAAGNSNSENVGYPAKYPECIAVSATRFDDQLTFYTNRGKRIDIAAPGGDMNVDQNGDGYKDGVLQNTIVIQDPTQQTYSLYQGTSMASPHVAGAAALLVSLGITDPEAVRERLTSTARKDGLPDDLDKGYGGGVLDASKAVYRTGFLDAAARFVLAVGFLLGMLLFSSARPRLTAPLLAGLVFGSCGLFFIPFYVHADVPGMGLLTHAVSDWDLTLGGPAVHANPIFWSALIPLGLAVATFGHRRWQAFTLGLCLGTAGFLLHQVIYTTAPVQGIPTWILGKLWLLLNVPACVFLAYVLAYTPAAAAEAVAAAPRAAEVTAPTR